MRLIYALKLTCESETGESVDLIAWLDRHGNALTLQPESVKRLVDARPGMWIIHKTGRYKIVKMEAWREQRIEDGTAPPEDGWLAPRK